MVEKLKFKAGSRDGLPEKLFEEYEVNGKTAYNISEQFKERGMYFSEWRADE